MYRVHGTVVRHLLIVDDHPLLRGAMVDLVARVRPDVRIAVAQSAAKMREQIQAIAPIDMAIIDLELPDASDLGALRIAHQCSKTLPLVVFSGHTSAAMITRCMQLGVRGFLPKGLNEQNLEMAMRRILDGERYFPESREGAAEGGIASLVASQKQLAELYSLSQRRLDVLRLIALGYSNKRICRELKIAEGTVKIHVAAILRKLNVKTRIEAVALIHDVGARLNS